MSQFPYHPGPAQPSPEERLLLMNDTDWEIFIEQCARQLLNEKVYTSVIRLGGAGDKGRDVCGHTQDLPLEGTWDLYQAKYYTSALSPSDFAPELAKFLWSVYSGDYQRPLQYFICALKIGPKLYDLVTKPGEFKAWILAEWKEKSGVWGTYKQPFTFEIDAFIKSFPFEIFKIKTSADLLKIHARSDKHWESFGVLASRGPNPEIPESPSFDEQKYIAALLDVYQEATNVTIPDASDIPSLYKKHFKVQRRLFYSAEGLNRFSRDKLPGAFDNLIDQVELGIGSELAFPHSDGISRLSKVLNTANTLPVTANALYARLEAGDLQGACHHLANQERISWMNEDE